MEKIDFKKLCKKYHEEALKTLVNDIKINSVYDPSTISGSTPYGKGVAECFKFLKEIALKDGFKVDECDGRCLEISYGEGKNLIYIFAHQDVVPVNGKWKFDPFSGVIEDNKVYGRGTSDDKGPGISSYFALKALKDNNLINNYRVRLVFGGDEERGSSCLEYYFNVLKKEQPTYGFTPDGDFPLIYGEKGICNYTYKGNIDFDDIIEIDAGTVSNSVIDRARVVVKDGQKMYDYLKNHPEIEVEPFKEGSNEFVFLGVAAHGSTPELGKNAGIMMLAVLGKVYNIQSLSLLANEYMIPDGTNMHLRIESKNLGVTTYNVGIIKYKNGKFKMTVNFRYPENVIAKLVVEKIQTISPFLIEIDSNSDYLYFDPEKNKFIQVLAKIYEEETGDNVNKMMTIGGGTYAKEAKNTVAFGSHFPNKEDHIHSANEKIDLEDFYNSMPLYARAIYELGNLNEN